MEDKKQQTIIANFLKSKFAHLWDKETNKRYSDGWLEIYESMLTNFLDYLKEEKLLIADNKKPWQKIRTELE